MLRTAAAKKVMGLQRARTLAFCLLALVVAASIGLLVGAKPAHAADFTVNSKEDAFDHSSTDGECSVDPFRPDDFEPKCTLRAAIEQANVNGESDTITFDPFLSGTIPLTLGQLEINHDTFADLIIEGPGANKITVSGNDASRVFFISSGASADVTISGLTISNGNSSGDGGGIYSDNVDTLTLTNTTVSGNSATNFGGGIHNNGQWLMLTNSTVSKNTAGQGGAISRDGGVLMLTNSTVSKNTAIFGGGIRIGELGADELTNTTVSGNTATHSGGGIFNSGGSVRLTNSTVSGNSATGNDGRGGGIYSNFGSTTLSNTIVARNNATWEGPDVYGAGFTSRGHNLIGDATDATDFGASDLLNVNPRLGPLQDNGGPTDTHALLAGSRAVDTADKILCPPRDQRGFVRKDGDGNGTIVCDIGSFESNDLIPPKVKRVVPQESATGVAPATNVSAFFSEVMRAGSINSKTVKLFKTGNATPLAAQVTYDAQKKKAILNPNANLQRGAKYKAVVTVGAKDLAGNRLDQNPSVAGNQQKVWFFKVRN